MVQIVAMNDFLPLASAWPAVAVFIGRRGGGLSPEPPALRPDPAVGLGADALRALWAWRPNSADAQRVKQASELLKAALANPPKAGAAEAALALLKGPEPWPTLHRLALRHLGERAPVSTAASRAKPRAFSAPWPPSTAQQRPPTPLIWATSPVAQWAPDGDAFTIYLDEAWPEDRSGIGVIAGLVWWGTEVDLTALEPPPQHLRESPAFEARAISYLQQLASCRRAFPFAFHFRCPDGEVAREQYRSLVDHAVLLLLGWLLPEGNTPAELRVICESFGPSFSDGADGTERLRGVLAQARAQSPQRFGRWLLDRVQWRQKLLGSPKNQTPLQIRQQGYLSFGDLLGYVTTFPKAAAVRDWLMPERMEGYLPIDLQVIPLLSRLDHLAETGSTDDLFQALTTFMGTPFLRRLWSTLAPQVRARPALQVAILQALDLKYRDQHRDVARLAPLLDAVHRLVPEAAVEGGGAEAVRARTLWHLIAAQHANHLGDPPRATRHVSAYQALRLELEDVDRDLVAFAELVRAVHCADLFLFEEALQIVQALTLETWFLALPRLRQGYAHSARGQYLAMLGEHQNAEDAFVLALALFDQATITAEQRYRERDQTSTYRAMNAMDARWPTAPALVAEVLQDAGLGTIREAAVRLASDTGHVHGYHHHLLVRLLYFFPDVAVESAYLAKRNTWGWMEAHPSNLIGLYRGLLLFRLAESEVAGERVDQIAKEVVEIWKRTLIRPSQADGPTLALIRALVATVAVCCVEDPFFQDDARASLLDAGALPGAGPALECLRSIIDDPYADDVDRALQALSFNYH